MVTIYTACCSAVNSEAFINAYTPVLPERFLTRANAFRFKMDAQRFLLGKIMLVTGIQRQGLEDFKLDDLREDEFHKPFFPGNIHFNISHSGNYVVCAISNNNPVGIDIEEIAPIDMQEFTKCFTEIEWKYIQSSDLPLRNFYHFWTRKEAVIKADGRGLHLPLLSFEVLDDAVIAGHKQWHLSSLTIDNEYCAHLATGTMENNYSIQQIL